MKFLLPLILAFAIGAPLGPPIRITEEVGGMREWNISSYSWSPDGTQIAYIIRNTSSANAQPDAQLMITNSDGSHPHLVSSAENTPTNSNIFLEPVWSPDGSQIAFVSGVISDTEIIPFSIRSFTT